METELYIINEIRADLEAALDRCGILYRLFARGKSTESFRHKITSIPGKYASSGKKVQDFLGFRIVFYFIEDVKTFCDYLINDYKCDIYESKSDSEAEFKETPHGNVTYEEVFRPQRLNLIFRMNKSRAQNFKNEISYSGYLSENEIDIIDTTYEVQLRSVLSEGWHEIEHDLRYKCKGAPMWKYCESESRSLNGIYASLETNEIAMELIFDKMAYYNYKNKDWEDMLRNHFRIRISPYSQLSKNNVEALNSNNKRTAKRILGIKRADLLHILLSINSSFPINYDNLVFLTNRMLEHDANDEILSSEPPVIRDKLDTIFRE